MFTSNIFVTLNASVHLMHVNICCKLAKVSASVEISVRSVGVHFDVAKFPGLEDTTNHIIHRTLSWSLRKCSQIIVNRIGNYKDVSLSVGGV